ncbi:AraC family transcriptional regulator [uncultured Nitratireductor sp.]|uniref:AraC family transcriptional regulator n=1 Tax=uncultured Nitratireductor sp. TaxID=520953 RepID=UPI0025DF5F8E|nr:AraC family transcriptional regulator [uncultured Nitratireductor sp.]
MSGLKALYRHRIFHSRERMDSHALVANELADHHLRWYAGRVDTQLYKFDTPRLSLYSLRYGAEVGILPDLYDRFSLVHFSLSGGIEIEADRQRQSVRQGQAIVSTPTSNINLRWSQNSEQLILRLPHSLLEDTANAMRMPDLYRAMRQNPGLMLSDAAARQWQAQLQAFVALEGSSSGNEALQPWLAHLEHGMAMFLLLQLKTKRHDCGEEGATRLTVERRRLDRLYDYAAANLSRPVTLSDLARAAALSERHLNTFCQTHLGLSPMSWLRGLRLDALRATLQAHPERELADLAMLHGFFHLGRFSAAYRDRFGELPSETRKIARNG